MYKHLVNAQAMVAHAKANKYAIPAFNVNNLEWLKTILSTLNQTRTPALLAFSEGAIRYMGGYECVVHLVNHIAEYLKVDIPVCIHLDHGTYEGCFKAIDAGFTSVMFDGSALEFADNFQKSSEVVAYAQKHNVSVELEVGAIGGVEDDVVSEGELTKPAEAVKMAELKPNMLACGIGNIHGLYPSNWKGLNFALLQEINDLIESPLTLHGGSGIPLEQIQHAVSLGISKVNINTEVQIAYAQALQTYFANKDIMANKAYAFRTINNFACEKMSEQITTLVCNLKADNRV
ncbi:ketose-bisphosphate aldolase [Ureaplasma miroungigenitalium]|uniref:Ketose-bisphosphate aldolase n=1 Tax=Ureaplasma miroungigenitalium TaxID=1042321 RepID=A0ABT3BN98_9BACT|nr:ketose-bisphosphate aldolase [Ureaplasma miroungigenitalium]MCV3728717.1 ketose-bisphosphate aldolase [Ureaplasma miroungigenitalium]MCV3734481.1 ketose-bisphosphate aldolase [Ureaplasma miroungigenitalium]